MCMSEDDLEFSYTVWIPQGWLERTEELTLSELNVDYEALETVVVDKDRCHCVSCNEDVIPEVEPGGRLVSENDEQHYMVVSRLWSGAEKKVAFPTEQAALSFANQETQMSRVAQWAKVYDVSGGELNWIEICTWNGPPECPIGTVDPLIFPGTLEAMIHDVDGVPAWARGIAQEIKGRPPEQLNCWLPILVRAFCNELIETMDPREVPF